MNKRFLLLLAPFWVFPLLSTHRPHPIPAPALTAGQIITRIQGQLTCKWAEETVDKVQDK